MWSVHHAHHDASTAKLMGMQATIYINRIFFYLLKVFICPPFGTSWEHANTCEPDVQPGSFHNAACG